MKKKKKSVVKKLIGKRPEKELKYLPEDLLRTGSTLLDLNCSGMLRGGFLKGFFILMVGDSSSGKTFLTQTCLAEATINKHFDDHRIIFDNAENGAFMDTRKFFGSRLVDRMEPPAVDSEGDSIFSQFTEEFLYHVEDAFDEGTPFIYLLDSSDALDTEGDEKKFQKRKKAAEEGKTEAGSFGADKPKLFSMGLRRIIPRLEKTGSILIVINQTRDNLGFGAQYNPKIRSGGRALRFYNHLEIWSSIKGKIKKTVKGKKRQVGIQVKLEIKKNRFTGRERELELPIYYTYGIDDIGSCIDYLIEEGHWKKPKGSTKITAKEFRFEGSMDKLIKTIEDDTGKVKKLKKIVKKVFLEIEAALDPGRKRRYE